MKNNYKMLLRKEKESAEVILKSLSKKLKGITKKTEEFLNPSNDKVQKIENFLKDVYSFTTNTDESAHKNFEIVPDLYVESLDAESVWQQIDIKNNVEMPTIIEEISNVLAISDTSLGFKIKLPSDEKDDEYNEDNFPDEDQEDQIVNEKKDIKIVKKKKTKESVVDDKFFKLSEMDAFLKQEDKHEMLKGSNKIKNRDVDDGINYFTNDFGIGDESNDDDDEGNVNYKDFFGDGSESEEDENKNEDDNYEENLAKNKSQEYEEAEEQENEEDEEDDEDEEDQEDEENEEDQEDEEDEKDEEDQECEEDQNEEENEITNFEDHEKNDQGRDEIDENESDNEENDNSNSDNDSDEVNKLKDNKKNPFSTSNDDGPKSSFEIKQDKLNEKIEKLEEQALGDKPWQLKGEIKAYNRPQNSLLEEILEFDVGSRPAPIITQETNLKLEDIIRQRIKDQAWDDPERKIKPVNVPQDFRKKVILDGEKSKESLAQIYEREYQQQLEKLNGNDATENEEELKEHKEIKGMMAELFKKLDALSNFHFTPKPTQPEPKIITNIPAIQVEEVAPLAVSDAQLLAPEEIKSNSKGDVFGQSERTKTDKNRERRYKKQYQKKVFKAKEQRETEKLKAGIPLTKKEDKEKALRNVIKNRNVSKMSETSDSAIKSSKLFFNQLQGDTSVGVKVKRKPNKPSDSNLSAKKLKL